MKTFRLIVTAAALVLGAGASFVVRTQSSPTQVPPDAVVAKLYRQNNLVFQPKSRVLLDRYFEKSLADLIWKELLHYESSGRSEIEDFDYVLYNFGSGGDVTSVSKPVIGKPTYEGQKAQLNVSYTVVCAPPNCAKRSVDKVTIMFLLTAAETGWRITDIKYDCRSGIGLCVDGKTSLFEIYGMNAKATATEREYWEQKSNLLDAQLHPDVQGYKDYLQKYPNGAYAAIARAKIGQLEVPTRPQTGAILAPGPAMLFKGTTSKLSGQDKQLIFEKLEFSLSRNKKFIVVRDAEDCGDASPSVEIVDLNGDGVEEVFVQWGNLCLAGNTGSNSAVFVKNGSGQFVEVLNVLGTAGVVGTRNKGFPDIKISGPGFCFNVMQWNGTKYEYKCSHEERSGGCTQKGVTTICK